MRIALMIAGLGLAAAAHGQDLAISYRNAATLASTARDQFGGTFTVAGLSGITAAGGDAYWSIMDNSDRAVRVDIALDETGAIRTAAIAAGLRLAQSRDHEDLVWTGDGFLVCEETTPAIHEYDESGGLRTTITPPPIFATRRPNFGFEALAMNAAGTELWAANEEALAGDGPVSTPTNGTRVRLQRWTRDTGGAWTPGEQYAYLTAPMHAGAIQSGRSGLCALVMLPSGRLLAMERSLANNFLRFFETRIYAIDLAGATDTRDLGSLSSPHVAVTKHLLYQGGQTNLEGLCLGPRVGAGYALLGVVDDGDPISVNRVVSFVVTGDVDPGCAADFNGDGFLDFFDYDAFVRCYESGDCPDGADADHNGDGFLDFFDYDGYVESYMTGC